MAVPAHQMNGAGLCLTGRRGDAPYIPAMSKQYELRRLPMGEPWQIVDYDPSRGLLLEGL